MNANDKTTVVIPSSAVAEHEIAYWRAEQRLDAAMQQHMERLIDKVRQSAEVPVLAPDGVEPPRAGCLGLLARLMGR